MSNYLIKNNLYLKIFYKYYFINKIRVFNSRIEGLNSRIIALNSRISGQNSRIGYKSLKFTLPF